LKVVIVSDTHDQHEALGVLRGDVLIHCGDSGIGYQRNAGEVERLDDWFGRQDFRHILVIGGNHDHQLQARARMQRPVLRNAAYLQDDGMTIDGILFYGAPWTPELVGWAYYLPQDQMRRKWDLIPDNTDVLITHTPPSGILDRNSHGKACGCPDLQRRVAELRPRVHCFGHVHASAGILRTPLTTYVNAAMVNSRYEIVHRPCELELSARARP